MVRKRKDTGLAEEGSTVLDGVGLVQQTAETWAVQFRFQGKPCSKLLYGTRQTAASVRELVAIWLCYKAGSGGGGGAVAAELQQLQHGYEHFSFLLEALKHSKSVEALWKVVGKFCRGEFEFRAKQQAAAARPSGDESTGRSTPAVGRLCAHTEADGAVNSHAALHLSSVAMAAAANAALLNGQLLPPGHLLEAEAAAIAAHQMPVVDPVAAGLPPLPGAPGFPAAAAALQAALLYARGDPASSALPVLWQQQFPGVPMPSPPGVPLPGYPPMGMPGQLADPDAAAAAAAAAAAGVDPAAAAAAHPTIMVQAVPMDHGHNHMLPLGEEGLQQGIAGEPAGGAAGLSEGVVYAASEAVPLPYHPDQLGAEAASLHGLECRLAEVKQEPGTQPGTEQLPAAAGQRPGDLQPGALALDAEQQRRQQQHSREADTAAGAAEPYLSQQEQLAAHAAGFDPDQHQQALAAAAAAQAARVQAALDSREEAAEGLVLVWQDSLGSALEGQQAAAAAAACAAMEPPAAAEAVAAAGGEEAPSPKRQRF